jgi:alkylation response protein AidB-like acyl-CoA dehydrogenase
MRFAFTQDQLDFAEAVRDLLTNECGPERLRVAWDNDTGRIPGLWDRLVEMGVVGLLAPEGVGGLALAEIDLVRIAYEAGRVALPEPLSAQAGVVVPALRDHAPTADAERFLTDVCAGTSTVALGLAVNPLVVGAADASMFLLEAADGFHLVDPDVVELVPEVSVDGSRRVSRVVWNPSPATLMCGAEGAVEALARAATFTAAELCGLADTMLGLTTGYVTERKQFGVPIGSFQAIKHHCANALLKVEFAKPLVWRAAYSLAQGDPDAPLHASMAKAAASDAADVVGRIAMQCHGGIGYTVEYDLHLYLKRAWALVAQDGSAASHRRRVADAVLG